MPQLTRLQARILTIAGIALGVLLMAWFAFTIALTNAGFATPFVNWGLSTFAAKEASVQRAELTSPFSTTFRMQTFGWPEVANFETLNTSVNLLGWLPGRPWLSTVEARNGEIRLGESDDGKDETFNPQQLVDRIEAEDIDIRFIRGGEGRVVKIVEASGSFAKGTARASAATPNSWITFDGLARRGVNNRLEGKVTVEGENLAELARTIGAAAPDTPPYLISGDLSMRSRSWTISNIAGNMGDSDIAGSIAIDLSDPKPFLDVDLASQELDFDDLGVVFGIPVGAGEGETSNETQETAKAAYDRSNRLIPNAKIDTSRLSAVNGDFKFRAASIVDAPSGVSALDLTGTLRDSVLEIESAHIEAANGVFDARLTMDATNDPAATSVEGAVEGMSLPTLLGTPMIRGDLSGNFALELSGSDFRQAFATADGEISAWSTNSELARLATEAAGLDIGEVFIELSRADPDSVPYRPSRCLAANIVVRNGVTQFDPAVLDNSDTLIIVYGGVNLDTEVLNIEIDAHPKDVSFGTVFGDVTIKGRLRDPQINALGGEAILQAAVAAALASVSGPLAALPFIQTGAGEDAPCAQLLAQAGANGEPASTARPPG